MSVDKLFVAMKAFVRHNGKILLLKESEQYEDGTAIGKWGIPGGRLNPNEPWREALLREVKEETGLEITVGQPFFVGEWWPQVRGEQWHVVATFCVCESKGDNVKLSDDHADYGWIDPQQYASSGPYATDIAEAFQAYNAMQKDTYKSA